MLSRHQSYDENVGELAGLALQRLELFRVQGSGCGLQGFVVR